MIYKNRLWQSIIQYKKEHPDVTSESIARIFNYTRQSIHSIITEARKGDPAIPLFKKKGYGRNFISICKYCNKPIISKLKKKYSHRTCFHEHVGSVQLKCPICCASFPLLKSQYRYRLAHGQERFYDKRECLYESRRKK